MRVLLLSAAFILPFFLALLFIPLLRNLATWVGLTDSPDGIRKLHAGTTPTGGGLAIAAATIGGLVYLYFLKRFVLPGFELPHPVLWVSTSIVVLAGFYDDMQGLGFKQKLFYQSIAAYALMYSGYRIDVSGFPFVGNDPFEQAMISLPLTFLWIVGLCNAVNLIDGLDGLAAGVSMIAFVAMASIYGINGDIGAVLLVFPMLGALASFLVFNSNPATIFMGDSGSLFLGFTLAAYSLQGQTHSDPIISFLIPVVALGVPIADTGLAVVRRLMAHKAICAPDHDHIHHRLLSLFSTRQAVLILYISSVWFGASAILMAIGSVRFAVFVLFVTVVISAAGILLLSHLAQMKSVSVKAGPEDLKTYERVLSGVQTTSFEKGSIVAEKNGIEGRVETVKYVTPGNNKRLVSSTVVAGEV